MSTNEILLKFAKAGINLSPTQYEIVKEKYDNVKNQTEFLDTLICIAKFNVKEKELKPKPFFDDVTFMEVITWER